MPAILLSFELPLDYPSKAPPRYKIFSRWLSSHDLDRVCSRLDQLWDQSENSNILFTWMSFLADDIFDFLGLDSSKPINVEEEKEEELDPLNKTSKRGIKLPCSANLLKKYNNDQEEAKFLNAYHSCEVCFQEKPGFMCFQFVDCKHVYCNECMKTYFETQITDGNVKRLFFIYFKILK